MKNKIANEEKIEERVTDKLILESIRDSLIDLTVLNLYDRGLSQAEIKKRLGIGSNRASKLLKGLKKPHGNKGKELNKNERRNT